MFFFGIFSKIKPNLIRERINTQLLTHRADSPPRDECVCNSQCRSSEDFFFFLFIYSFSLFFFVFNAGTAPVAEELPSLHLSVLVLVYLWQVARITTCQHSLCYLWPPSSASSFQGSQSMNESTWSARRLLQLLSWKHRRLREKWRKSDCAERNIVNLRLKGRRLSWRANHRQPFPRPAAESDLMEGAGGSRQPLSR